MPDTSVSSNSGAFCGATPSSPYLPAITYRPELTVDIRRSNLPLDASRPNLSVTTIVMGVGNSQIGSQLKAGRQDSVQTINSQTSAEDDAGSWELWDTAKGFFNSTCSGAAAAASSLGNFTYSVYEGYRESVHTQVTVPLVNAAYGLVCKSTEVGVSLAEQGVGIYRNLGLTSKPVIKLNRMREWWGTAHQISSSFDHLLKIRGPEEKLKKGKARIDAAIADKKSSGTVKDAKKVLDQIFRGKDFAASHIYKFDVNQLKQLGKMMSVLLTQFGDSDGELKALNKILIESVEGSKEDGGDCGDILVPNYPQSLSTAQVVGVRVMDEGEGSNDLDRRLVLNLDGKAVPEFAELTPLQFWLEFFKTDFNLKSAVEVVVVK